MAWGLRRIIATGAVVTLAVLVGTVVYFLSGPLDMRVFRAAAPLSRSYLIAEDVPYRRVGDWIGRIDIFRPEGDGPFPVILYFHGGGWHAGSHSQMDAWALPFLATGQAVISVSYRLLDQALAPAAVADARCALGWVGAHGAQYRLDSDRVATAGTSAGGHLALMAGLVNGTSPFDTDCEWPPVRVKAILNYAGITDVEALLRLQLKKYPDGYPFAVDWIGQGRDRFDLAKRVSPLQWIDASDPPVFTVHGTADETVPYEQATMLHQALGQVGVMSELMALTGRNHTDVSVAELTEIARRMQTFIVRALGS